MAAVLGKLAERELRAALRALQCLADQSSGSATFVDAALEQLTGVVASDLTTLSLCDLARGTRNVIGRKGEHLSEADRAAFDRHFRDHPLVRFHSSHPRGPTQRISDCVSVNHFRNSAVHTDYYRRIGINHVMALPLHIDDATVISIVFNRARSDFRDGERNLLDAIRVPLGAIYRHLAVCEAAGFGLGCMTQLAAEGGWQVMRVTLTGRILEASARAFAMLARFFPRFASGQPTQLPAELLEWFTRSRHWGLERPAIRYGQRFSVTRQGSRLTLFFVPDTAGAAAGTILMKSEPLEVRAEHLAHLALTGRERAVLALVAAGKTNGEIATILAISARTVQKHLEHVFQKLGVETRTAAAIHALGAVDQAVAH